MTTASKLASLRDERKKQMALYKSLPDQKDQAAQEIAGRIHQIDKNIAKIEAEPKKSGGVPIWVWILGAFVCGGIAWLSAFLAGQNAAG